MDQTQTHTNSPRMTYKQHSRIKQSCRFALGLAVGTAGETPKAEQSGTELAPGPCPKKKKEA